MECPTHPSLFVVSGRFKVGCGGEHCSKRSRAPTLPCCAELLDIRIPFQLLDAIPKLFKFDGQSNDILGRCCFAGRCRLRRSRAGNGEPASAVPDAGRAAIIGSGDRWRWLLGDAAALVGKGRAYGTWPDVVRSAECGERPSTGSGRRTEGPARTSVASPPPQSS